MRRTLWFFGLGKSNTAALSCTHILFFLLVRAIMGEESHFPFCGGRSLLSELRWVWYSSYALGTIVAPILVRAINVSHVLKEHGWLQNAAEQRLPPCILSNVQIMFSCDAITNRLFVVDVQRSMLAWLLLALIAKPHLRCLTCLRTVKEGRWVLNHFRVPR